MDPPDRTEFLRLTVSYLQQGDLVQGKESLQKTHQYFQDLLPSELSKPTLQEIEIVNKAEKISIENVAWSLRNGVILLPQTFVKNNFFVRFANVVGAVALITICVDIAEKVFEQLKVYIENAKDEESIISLGVALNNLGCVYIIKGSFQNAKVSLQRALAIFRVLKTGKECVTVEEKILTIANNLRLVRQAQRSYVTDMQLQNDLLSNVNRFAIQPRITAVVDYNEAVTSLESRNLRKALDELENLKAFCETKLHLNKGLLTFILLKIRLLCLMLQASSGTTTFIDSKISTLQGLKELVDVSTNFSLDFSVTTVETVADIHLYQGNLDLVCSYFSYLVPVVRERCGADHPTVASFLSKQGLAFLHLENFARSRQCFTDALEIFTGAFGAIHPDVLKCNAGLARLEWLGGNEEKSLTHSQTVLENVERICQVSLECQLKPKFIELSSQSERTPSPDVDHEEQLKLETLVSEFGIEITRVLNQHQPSDLGDRPGALSESDDFVDSSISKEFYAKLSFNWLKAGLCLFNVGVDQSVAFLFLSCTYASMFYDHLDCSEVILLKVIFLVCQLKSKKCRTFLKVQERLRKEFGRLKSFIEDKAKRFDEPESKIIFFDENTNLMVALAVILRTFVEMEMYEMIADVHSLLSFLSNQQSPQVTHVFLVEELRFAFFSSNIQCLGKEVMHDLILLTPLGMMNNRKVTDENDADTPCYSQSKELTTSLREDENFRGRKSRQIFKTLALKTDSNQWKGSRRFLVECPISRGVDISALNEINAWSINAVEDSLPHLILCSPQSIELTAQYFLELELLASAESTLSSISGDFSLLPLVLSAAKDGSESETQTPVLVNTENTHEGSLSFIFQDKIIANFLFGKLLKQILTNEGELGEVVNVVVKDSQLVLNIQGPPIGQIVIRCHEDTIKVKTHLIHYSQSRRKVEIVREEVPPCNCSPIETAIADKMEKCARSFGIHFETKSDDAWCTASQLTGNARDISMRVSVLNAAFITVGMKLVFQP